MTCFYSNWEGAESLAKLLARCNQPERKGVLAGGLEYPLYYCEFRGESGARIPWRVFGFRAGGRGLPNFNRMSKSGIFPAFALIQVRRCP